MTAREQMVANRRRAPLRPGARQAAASRRPPSPAPAGPALLAPPAARSARGGRRAAPPGPASRGTRRDACSGVLGKALQGGAEGLLLPPSARPRARPGSLRKTASQSTIAGELAAAEHVAADRDHVAGEVLEDALVEALVAAAQQRQLRLGRELVDERVVEQPPARGQRDHPPALAQRDSGRPRSGPAARCRARRRAAPSRRRRRTGCRRPGRRSAACARGCRPAPAREPPASTLATWRWPRNHSNHSGNSVKTSIFTTPPRAVVPGGHVLEEASVDVDRAPLGDVDACGSASLHQRHQQRRGAAARGRTSSASQEGSSSSP